LAVDSFTFALFSFLHRIAGRAPDLFRMPHDAVIEVNFRVGV
jgi:KUP system potassium uptake protein